MNDLKPVAKIKRHVMPSRLAYNYAKDRIVARRNKDYEESDNIRGLLESFWWRVEDNVDHTLLINTVTDKRYRIKTNE